MNIQIIMTHVSLGIKVDHIISNVINIKSGKKPQKAAYLLFSFIYVLLKKNDLISDTFMTAYLP